ncbi:MAG: hypothetical protein WBW31_00815, partial [Candidatus Sulfotelmatobacter sp.]
DAGAEDCLVIGQNQFEHVIDTPKVPLSSQRCHPEAGAFCPPKDPGEPRQASRFLRRNNGAFGSLP